MSSSPEVLVLFFILSIVFFVVSFFSTKIGLVIMVIAMIFSPEIPLFFLGSKPVLVRIEDFLIPVLSLAWMAQLSIRNQITTFEFTPLNKPILMLLGLTFISTIHGALRGWIQPVYSFFCVFKTCEFFFVYFLVINLVKGERQIKQFLFFALLTVFLLALYTLAQVPSIQIFTDKRITAPFEGTPEPATIGGYMAFLLLIMICLFLYEVKRIRKWIYAVTMFLILVPFVYTLNRTSYAALVIGLIFIASKVRKRWLTALLILLLAFAPLWLPRAVKDRIAYTWLDAANPGRELGVDYSFQERIYAFRKVFNLSGKSPVLGFGVTSLDILDNQYARTFHELGVFGLIFWGWIFVRLLRMSRWLFKTLDGGTLKGLALGYQAGVLGILIHCFGTITLYVVRIMEPFWFVTGLVVSLYLVKLKEFEVKGLPHDRSLLEAEGNS